MPWYPKGFVPRRRYPRGQQGSQGPLGLLRWPDGASLKELMKATGGLAHSVHGYLSAVAVEKRVKLKLVSAKSEDGERRYSVQRW